MRRLLLLLLLAGTACGRTAPKPAPGKPPASGTMMAGDSMAMMATRLIPAELAWLDSLEAADPLTRSAAIADHVVGLPTLLKAIETDLMHLGMHRDSAYEALVDSVRQDAAGFRPGIPLAPELLHAHRDRVRRMIAGYQAMVGKGKRG